MRRLCAGPSLRHRSFRTLRRHPSGLYTFSRRGLGSGLPSAHPDGFPEFGRCAPERFRSGGQVYQGSALPLSYGSETPSSFSPPPPHPLPRTRMLEQLYAPELPTEFSSNRIHSTGFCHVCFFSEWGGLLVLSGSSSVRPKWHERPFGERRVTR